MNSFVVCNKISVNVFEIVKGKYDMLCINSLVNSEGLLPLICCKYAERKDGGRLYNYYFNGSNRFCGGQVCIGVTKASALQNVSRI